MPQTIVQTRDWIDLQTTIGLFCGEPKSKLQKQCQNQEEQCTKLRITVCNQPLTFPHHCMHRSMSLHKLPRTPGCPQERVHAKAATYQMVALVRLIVQMSSKAFSHNLINESVELPSWRQNGFMASVFTATNGFTLWPSPDTYICAQTINCARFTVSFSCVMENTRAILDFLFSSHIHETVALTKYLEQ